jgi:diketogulonate reductase-like aldo/keto reductase
MPKHGKVSRREFLGKSGLVVGAVAAMPAIPPRIATDATVTPKLPHRTLGRTGASVSILAMGCGSRFLMYRADQATAVLEKAVGLGIDYLDTAVGYGDGESETRLGRFLATRRKDVFLATKVPTRARTRDAALEEVEASLKRLQTDHLDLLHLHSLGDEADLAAIEAKDGAIKALYELREQKVARFIGMTSHTDGAVMARAIEHNDLDCVQMAMNPARAARFEELALPAANKKNLGVILMKVTGQDKLMVDGGADPASLLRYAWSLPVSAAVCGCRSWSTSRRTWPRRGPTPPRCPPRRWSGSGSSWPAGRSCSSASSPTTTTGAGRRSRAA